MKLSLDTGATGNLISTYGPGHVVVNEERIEASVIVTPGEMMRDWEPVSVQALEPRHLEPLLALAPEIVVLGSGARQRFPGPEIFEPLLRRRIGLEVMDTGAACRTYNVLVAEDRRVAAALLMIEAG